MADNNEKKIIIDVEIGDSNSIKKLADLRKYSDDLKKAQKQLDTSTDQGRTKYEQYALEIQKTNTEIRTLQKEIQTTEKLNAAEAGSLDELNAKLELAKSQYKRLGDERKKSAEGQDLQKSIEETIALIKEQSIETSVYYSTLSNLESALGKVEQSNNRLGSALKGLDSFLPGISKGLTGITTKIIAMGKAALANPILAIIAAVVAILMALKKAIGTSEEATAKWNAILAPLNRLIQFLLSLVQKLVGWLLDGATAMLGFYQSVAKLLEKLPFVGKYIQEANQAIERSIKLEREKLSLDKQMRDYTVESARIERDVSELRAKANDKLSYSAKERLSFIKEANALEKQSADESLAIAKQKLAIAEEEASWAENTKETEEQLAQLRADVYRAETGYYNKMRELKEKENSFTNEIANAQKDSAAKAQEASTKSLEIQQKRIDAVQRLSIAMIQAESDYQSEDFDKRQTYVYRIFNLQQESELSRLKLQLRYGKMRQDEFNKECQILLAAQQQFSNEQLKLAEQYQQDIRKNLFELLDSNIDNQIIEIERKYTEALEQLGEVKLPVFQEGMDHDLFAKEQEQAERLILERAQLEVEMENQKQKQISEIRKQSVEKQAKEIETIIREEYKNDLSKYTDNEKEKLRIQIEQQKNIIEKKKKAGLETFEDEATLRGLQASQNQIALNTELLQANLTAKQRYELKKAYLEAEQKLHAENALKQLEIGRELIENEQELLQERLGSFEEWSNSTMELMSGLNEFVSNLETAQVEKYEKDNEKKKEKLKDRLDKGYISQKEYDQKVSELDKELDKKKAEAARKQAIREKAMGAFQIGINTAMGIMKTIGTLGFPLAIPFIALAAAAGALQLAAVLSKPIPKAAKGRLIAGPSHAAGGTLIEAEGGEAIINKRSVQMFAPLLSAINEAGGGIPFSRPLSDGGYAVRSSSRSNNITLDDMQTAFSDAVSQIQIITTVEDIQREEGKYTNILSHADY